MHASSDGFSFVIYFHVIALVGVNKSELQKMVRNSTCSGFIFDGGMHKQTFHAGSLCDQFSYTIILNIESLRSLEVSANNWRYSVRIIEGFTNVIED